VFASIAFGDPLELDDIARAIREIVAELRTRREATA